MVEVQGRGQCQLDAVEGNESSIARSIRHCRLHVWPRGGPHNLKLLGVSGWSDAL